MKKINNEILKTTIRNTNTKKEPCTKYSSLMMQLVYSLSNFFDYTESNTTAYEVALWIKSKVNLIHNKGKLHNKLYHPKSIINVDLGNNAFGSEFSYLHPCVVIYNEYNRLFVVPCTSQPARRDGKGNLFPENLEGTNKDGFAKTTTIKLNEARFIDKTRVIGEKLGTVEDDFYKVIYDKLFSILFESKAYSLDKLQSEKTRLELQLENVQKEKEELISRLEAASSKD